MCISTGRVLDDKRPREYSDQQYLKSAEEMCALFADIPDAIDNTLALAERCNIEMRLGTYFLPNYPVPDDETLDTWIQKMSRDGLEERLEKNPLAPGKTREEYFERLEFELNTIIKMGFPGYFLVADFIQWGKNQGIPIGPGRGSGSRFAGGVGAEDHRSGPAAVQPAVRALPEPGTRVPDFDIDFCMDRRDEVIDSRRPQVRARASARSSPTAPWPPRRWCATPAACSASRTAWSTASKLIPNILGIHLKDALGKGKEGPSSEMASAELIQRYETEDDVRDLIDLALQLEDLTRNASTPVAW